MIAYYNTAAFNKMENIRKNGGMDTALLKLISLNKDIKRQKQTRYLEFTVLFEEN